MESSITPRIPYPDTMRKFPVLRQSLLSTFDQCALQSRFDQELSQGWQHPWQARGSTFHRFASKALREMQRMGEQTIEVDVALAILMETLRMTDLDHECPHCGSAKIKRGVTRQGNRRCLSCRRTFETELTNLPIAEIDDLVWIVKKFAYDNTFDTDQLVSIEERLTADVEYPNPYGGYVTRTLTGKPDAILLDRDDENHAILLDWKDTWGMPAATEVSFEGYFQQRFYAWLIMRTYKSVQRVTLREFYVRYSEPREATIIRERLDTIELTISALVERFDRVNEERLWRPTPGKQCSFCPTPNKCPILPDARADGRITTPRDARRAAAQLVVGEEVVKQLRQALGQWAKNHGEVPVRSAKGRRVFGHREALRVKAPTAEQIAQAQAQHGRLTDTQIRGLFKETRGTRFEAYTPVATPGADEELLEQLRQTVAAPQKEEA